MSAPQSVVEAVMESLGCRRHDEFPFCATHPWGRQRGIQSWSERGCVEAVEAADAAWKASLNAAAERIEAECSKDDWGVPSAYSVTLNRWAEEDQP